MKALKRLGSVFAALFAFLVVLVTGNSVEAKSVKSTDLKSFNSNNSFILQHWSSVDNNSVDVYTHVSHSSHQSHQSHYSHQSHCSHYSHYSWMG